MPEALRLALALAGFGLGFAPTWFTVYRLPPALLAGTAVAFLVYLWTRRLEARGPAPWALERLAMRLAFRRGSVSAEELAEAAGVERRAAEEVLDGLAGRGLARKEGDRYRF